jgi:S-DNA-T family DNA segregation ATPase FtsK/SpoIIIE
MPTIDINAKRGDPNARIDLETFWSEISDSKDERVENFSGDWDTDFGKTYPRYQDPVNDLILPLGRLENGKYGLCNLSINLNLLAVGSALSGLGVFRRAALAHLTRTHTPEQHQIVIIDPLRVLSDFDGVPHLAVPRAVSDEEIRATLQWVLKENERRLQLCEGGELIYIQNKKAKTEDRVPRLLVIVSELGEIGIENDEVQGTLVRVMQMARATEINTILCTQQPSEERLPKIVLSNTPVKIAFKLPYKEISERIIGKAGAEELLGQGDMIFTNEYEYWRMQGFHI